MSKFTATLAALMLVVPASALAQDLRSPDARPAAQQDYRSPDSKIAVFKQDYRSPDARPTQPSPAAVSTLNLRRSPDATPRGQFIATAPVASTGPSDSFNWGLLAGGLALVLIGLGAATLTQRRRRHGLAIGS